MGTICERCGQELPADTLPEETHCGQYRDWLALRVAAAIEETAARRVAARPPPTGIGGGHGEAIRISSNAE
jgi:hypothetical protein